jgi:hypothetical protein
VLKKDALAVNFFDQTDSASIEGDVVEMQMQLTNGFVLIHYNGKEDPIRIEAEVSSVVPRAVTLGIQGGGNFP